MAAMRIIFVTRGIRAHAAIIGYFEMLIWLVGVTQIMQNLNNPINYIAFAAGFSMGTFVGITIEKRIAIGNLAVQFITDKDPAGLLTYFRANGYGATTIDAQGTSGPVKIIFIIVRRKLLDRTLDIIKKFDPNALFCCCKADWLLRMLRRRLIPSKYQTQKAVLCGEIYGLPILSIRNEAYYYQVSAGIKK